MLHNKILILTFIFFSAFCLRRQALVAISSSNDWIECFTAAGNPAGLMFKRSDWLESDGLFSMTVGPDEIKSIDELELKSGFLNWVDYASPGAPAMLWWRHSRYWVNVYPEKTSFYVLYFDPYGIEPSAGWPVVRYRLKGEISSSFSNTLTLRYSGDAQGGRIYSLDINLSTGVYEYQYASRNPNRPDEFSLEISSFVVSKKVENFETISITEGKYVSTAWQELRWKVNDPFFQALDGNLYFKVYLGTSASSMALVYEGYDNYCRLKSLENGKEYLWYVEAINIYGVVSRSVTYSFKTIAPVARAFNYPNPFNPEIETTNIVFNMAKDGWAEVSIFTEMGDLVWRKTFHDGLLKGSNEIVYDGRDQGGSKTLYNGPYVVVINKNYQDGSREKDRCRILIIK